MLKGRIQVNKTAFMPPIVPPSNADVLLLSHHHHEDVKAMKIINGGEHVEQGSKFYSFAAKVTSLEDINKAYMKMRIKHADSTHICCAYHLEGVQGVNNQFSVDDGEIGASRRMLQVLKDKDVENLAIFVVRHYWRKTPG